MNPINAQRKEEIKRITERILKTFSTEYLRAFKKIAIRDAKKAKKKDKKEEDSSNEEPRQLKSTPEDPHRPRGENKHKREISPELKVKITSWETLDSDIDPYVSYIVEASLEGRTSSVYRRYNQFKSLNKKVGKKVPEAKKTFPTAKTFEGRKFDYNYVWERRNKLQKFLDSVISNKELHKDETLIKWLGLQPPADARFAEVFDVAFTNTKWRLWVWKRIPYDEEEEAIAKLVIEEIKREMLSDILAPLPSQPAQIRATAAASAYKVISTTVGPIVGAGWKVAREAIEPLKPKVSEVIDGAIDKLLEVEDQLKKKLTEAINEGLSPIVDQLEPLLGKMSEIFKEPAFAVVKEMYPFREQLFEKLDHIAKTGDEKTVDEISPLVDNLKKQSEEKVNSILQKSLEGILGDLSKEVTIDALSSLFSPLKKLLELANTSFDIFLNPVPHVYCLRVLCEHRAKLMAISPTDDDFRDKVEDMLDYEESWLIWRRYWTYWDYRWKAWSLYYVAWGHPELSTVARILREHAFEFAIIHKKWIKKWSFRFGDHLHERAKRATHETWEKDVRESFSIGYQEANAYFKKRAYEILHKLVLRFFYAAIGNKVEEMLMKGLEPILEGVGSAIPPPINEILEVDTLARDSIKAALKGQVTRLVENSIVKPYVSAFAELKF